MFKGDMFVEHCIFNFKAWIEFWVFLNLGNHSPITRIGLEGSNYGTEVSTRYLVNAAATTSGEHFQCLMVKSNCDNLTSYRVNLSDRFGPLFSHIKEV